MSFQNWLAENFSRRMSCAAGHQNRARRLHPANTVIHGQTVIHPVGGLRTHHAGKPVAPLHDPGMADVGGFGQPGCAGGIDVERVILYGRWPLLVLAERLARLCFDLQIDARPRAWFVAVNPDRGMQRSRRKSRGQLAGELRSDDEMFRRNDIDAVGERRTRSNWYSAGKRRHRRW